ncbi:hypothetical protein ANANG_G00283320, partial [Anguilla anguilla]
MDIIEQLRDDMRLFKEETKATIRQLGENVSELHKANKALRHDLLKVREELQHKDLHILHLREQVHSITAAEQSPHSQTTDTGSQTETNSQTEPQTSLDINEDPSPPSPPQDNTALPASQTAPANAQPVTEEQRQTRHQQPPKTAILIDSNGKFLNHRQLFPHHSVGKFWCPHTDSALQLLCHERLGDPDNIIIHTGTNDLRHKGQNVPEAVIKVAEKAQREFPRAKITISTLLPRTNFPFNMITNINREITTECTKLTNVNIAHHPTLTHEHLYDHVHLGRDSVEPSAAEPSPAEPSSAEPSSAEPSPAEPSS